MKRMLAVFFGITMLLSVVGISNASAKPGPETGKSEKGLCTAYFNGQKKGHDKDNNGATDNARAFQGLEENAGTFDGMTPGNEEPEKNETDISDDVFEYCTNSWDIMGQPEKNGRFDCRHGEDRDSPIRDTDDDGEFECRENGTEPDPDPVPGPPEP